MKVSLFAAAAMVLAVAAGAGPADAKGCIKGTLVGGVAGHYAGHHGMLGAIGGCAVGHHMASEKEKAQQGTAVENARPTTPQQNGY
jgi:hypothetical protein